VFSHILNTTGPLFIKKKINTMIKKQLFYFLARKNLPSICLIDKLCRVLQCWPVLITRAAQAVQIAKDSSRVKFDLKPDLKIIVIAVCIFSLPAAANTTQDLAVASNSLLTFNIPAQSANITLGLIAKKSKTALLLSFNKVKSVTANEVKGVLSVHQALDAALADTRLKAFINDNGVITVKVVDTNNKDFLNMPLSSAKVKKIVSENKNMKTKKTLLASIMALIFSSAPGAQEISEEENKVDEIELIEVTGYRGGILSAQQEKRLADNIVDTINMDDIGKYSDDNLAESLQRVPGVQISRDDGGDGMFVSIRGLGPKFNRTTLNGRTVFGGGSTDGSSKNRRAFSFQSFPPELSSGVEVAKSPTADMDGGAIGGNINIKTHRPLDMKVKGKHVEDFYVTGSVDSRYNEMSEETDPRVSALGVWKISESLAVLGSVAYQERAIHTEMFRNFGKAHNEGLLVDEGNGDYSICQPGQNARRNGCTSEDLASLVSDRPVLHMGNNSAAQVNKGTKESTAYQFTAQWQPTNDFELIADWMSTELQQDLYQHELRFEVQGYGASMTDIDYVLTPQYPATQDDPNTEINESHPGLGAVITRANAQEGIGGLNNNEGEAHSSAGNFSDLNRKDDFYGLHATYNPNGGALTIDFDVSRLETEYAQIIPISSFDYTNVPSGFVYDTTIESGLPYFDYSQQTDGSHYNPGTDASGLELAELGWNIRRFGGEEDAVQMDIDWQTDFGNDAFYISMIETGAKYRSRTTDQLKDKVRFNCGDTKAIFAELGYDTANWAGKNHKDACRGDREAFLSANGLPTSGDVAGQAPVQSGGILNGVAPFSYDTWMTPDNDKVYDFWMPLLDQTGRVPQSLHSRVTDPNCSKCRSEFFEGNETIVSAYVKAGFGGEIATMPFRGNLGIRYEETETEGLGFVDQQAFTADGSLVLDEEGNEVILDPYVGSNKGSYTDWLPSGNITVELSDEILWRFAASKVIARPEPEDFSGASSVRSSISDETGEQGVNIVQKDPNLEPFRANQWETIVEWYPGETGASFALGYFSKDIESFVVRATSNPDSYEFQGINFTAQDDDPSTEDISEQVDIEVNTVTNAADGATINGVEFQTHLPFDWWLTPSLPVNDFTKVLADVGMRFSYTKLLDNESAEVDKITGMKLPVPGASEENYSAVLYYANRKFSARTSYTYRSSSLINPNLFNAAYWSQEYKSLDANVSYNFTPKMSVRLQLHNILGETNRSSFAEGLFPHGYGDNGRSATLGFRYSM